MANTKKDTITFESGRQIIIPGGIVSINKFLEVSDYYSRTILFLDPTFKVDKKIEPVQNIYQLTSPELIELADHMIYLWMNLKDNVRRYGIKSPEIFNIRG